MSAPANAEPVSAEATALPPVATSTRSVAAPTTASTSQVLRLIAQRKLFWGVLAAKLVMGTCLASTYLRDLFIPFVNYFIESHFSNPWTHFEHSQAAMFPYPPGMLYVLASFRLLASPFLPSGESATLAHLFVARLPLAICDVVILTVLLRWFPHRVKRVFLIYWCSPLIAYACYWHGQLDIIPTTLFFCAYHGLRNLRQTTLSAVLFALALSTKTHVIVALPFLFVYVRQEKGLREAMRYAGIVVLVYAAIVAPYLPSEAFRAMVYGSRQQQRLFAFTLTVGQFTVYIAPAVIALLWFRFVSYPRRNWDLLMLYTALLFCVFIVLAPPMPGYFLWSLPFLLHFICRTGRTRGLAYATYALSYLAFYWFARTSDLFDAWRIVAPTVANWVTPYQALERLSPELALFGEGILFTLMQTSLIGIIIDLYIRGIRANVVYRMREGPWLIAVAGDSGAGKDTFVHLVRNLLGDTRLSIIAGDDYHRWPRGHEMWRVYTHLNVSGNDLYKQQDHAVALSNGGSIMKGTYDHATGRFTEPEMLDAHQYVVFQGLHTLSLEAMREIYDLKFFLDPDETLRRFWKLKRDCFERGHDRASVLRALEEREVDRQKYILPQIEHADVRIRLISSTPPDFENLSSDPKIALEIWAVNSFNIMDLVNHLRVVPTMTVEHDPYINARHQRLAVSGTISAERVQLIAEDIVYRLFEITAAPKFLPDLNGCIQLLFLVCLINKLRWSDAIDT